MVHKQKTRLRVWLATLIVIPTTVLTVAPYLMKAPGKGAVPASSELGKVLATVNGEMITQRDAALFSSLPVSDFLGLLVDFKLLDQAANKGRVTVSDREVAEREQNLLQGSRAGSWERLASHLHRTPAGLALQVKHAALLEALASRRLKPPPGNMLHCGGIFVERGGAKSRSSSDALKFARFLQGKLDSGASVAELARKYSDDPPSKSRNGDLGICQALIPQQLAIHDHKLFLALDAAARTEKLKTPVEGENGYWAIRIVSSFKRPGSDTAAYEPMRQIWRSMWMQRFEPLVMNQLRDRAVIIPPLSRSRRH